MKDHLISIALCTYNGEKYIRAQLESIINQTYLNLEIIIVDDCSQDQTIKILQEIAGLDQRIKIYRNTKNLGFNKNFEKAISLTTGNFIAISDQDDIWISTKISELLNYIDDKWLVFSNSVFIKPDEPQGRMLLTDINLNVLSYKAFLFNNFVTGHTVLFKREFLTYLLPLPEQGYYDWYMGFIASYHSQIAYCNKVLTKYRVHSESVIQKREHEVLVEKKRGIENYKMVINQIKALSSYKGIEPIDRLFIKTIENSYTMKTQTFSLTLFKLILIHYNELFPFKRRKGFSLLNFAFKYAKKIV